MAGTGGGSWGGDGGEAVEAVRFAPFAESAPPTQEGSGVSQTGQTTHPRPRRFLRVRAGQFF